MNFVPIVQFQVTESSYLVLTLLVQVFYKIVKIVYVYLIIQIIIIKYGTKDAIYIFLTN